MKILIDARFYGLENAGIGRYVINLIKELGVLNTDNTYILLLRKKTAEFFNNSSEIPDKLHFKVVTVEIPHYSLKEQLLLPLIIIGQKPDLVHFPHFNIPVLYPGRFVVTIHDLIKHSSRGSETTTKNALFYQIKYWGYKFVFGQAIRRAKKIIVPSFSVKNNLLSVYKVPENRICVTYEGVDDKYKNSKKAKFDEMPNKYKIKKPYVVYTGSVYPHKNIEKLIEAIKLINKDTHLNLLISCARNIFWERLNKKISDLKAKNMVISLGFVSDNELVNIYQGAKAFVFPTIAEGFGLPGLEAMTVGCPVVCSNISVLKEVYGDAALYFDPQNINDISNKIKDILHNEELRQKLINNGYKQVKKYSWREMATQTLKIYQDLLS